MAVVRVTFNLINQLLMCGKEVTGIQIVRVEIEEEKTNTEGRGENQHVAT